MLRKHVDLCGLWRFQPDISAREGEQSGYFALECDTRFWREVSVPNDFEACAPGLDTYEGVGWFRRNVFVPEDWRGKRIILRFESVNYHAKVWVNGQEVGENPDGFLPFQFPVQDLIRFGGENVIAVKADNFRREGEVPGMQRGWRTFGGILREVELVATDPLYLDQVRIAAEPSDEGGKISIRAEVKNERPEMCEAKIRIQVTDSEGRSLASLTSQPVAIENGAETVFSLNGEVESINLWSPDTPELYSAEMQLCLDDQPMDEKSIRFGFRRIQTEDGKLLLNGEPIYLTGFNRHEDSPYRNMSTDLEMARQDLSAMKELGSNFVRLCHYPHHPGELDICDELGIMAMCEIPLYWWNGYQEGEENCARKLEAAKRQFSAMIRRDINHPSVIFWSASNETEEHRPEVVEGNRELVLLAKEMDSTRPAVHVSCHWKQHPHFDEDDVICVNSYPSLDRRGYRGQVDYDLSESTRIWRENLETLHGQYPHKPILVTEFGYASLEGVFGNGLGEDLQAEAIEKEFAGMDAPYVCGATIWCWADHPWPQATYDFCRHIGISPYGVVTRERRRLRAYNTVRRLFREKQNIQEKPRTSSSPGIGVTMIRHDMENIPQFPFPEGFSIRPMRLDEGGLWNDIVWDAEGHVSDRLFHRQFGSDIQATQWRSFIITNEKGVGVGTLSAWYLRDYRGENYGLIHWVAVRPAYQNKGLGKAGMSFALNKMAQWHDRCLLHTSIKRIPAIKIYLDAGLMPDLRNEHEIEKWRQVKDVLKHPTLEKLLP